MSFTICLYDSNIELNTKCFLRVNKQFIETARLSVCDIIINGTFNLDGADYK